ncbi:MAG: HlyD family efflux transporter periplasmic adaptor subunit [Bryobacterales bacterium]|nr:HlyD family efflux transporter periplasmic adaptor subunit [Bryobacterales bacterium]
MWLLGVAAVCGGLYWAYQRTLAEDAMAAKRAAVASIRTATVAAGTVRQTIRLTGTTAPEKYVTITGPRLRGSRSFSGGSGAFMGNRGGGGGGGGSTSVASTGSSSSGSTGSGTSSGSSATGTVTSNSTVLGGGSDSSAGGSTGSTASSSGGVRSAANALKAATSRSSSGSGRSRGAATSTAAGSTPSTTMGGDGLGSTASSIPGGGGGGGGGGRDFGSVLQKLVLPGAMVTKGDTVAEFDRQYMLLRVDDYKSGVDQQALNMRSMLANLEVTRTAHEQSIRSAKADVEKAKLDLKTIPVRSAMDSERFRLALEEAEARLKQLMTEVPYVDASEKAQVRISEMDLQESKLGLRLAEQNADKMLVKSPIEGLAVMMQIWRGGDRGQVQEGDQIFPGRPFMQIVDTNSMVVEAKVNQVDVERMRVGAKATVRFDAFPDLVLPAKIYSVAAMPSSTNSARESFLKEIAVRLKLEKMDPRVIPDLSVSADVVVEESEAEAIVPLGSVFEDSSSGKSYVYVKAGDRWSRREVNLGAADNLRVAVESGLKAGEIVAEEPSAVAASGKPGV